MSQKTIQKNLEEVGKRRKVKEGDGTLSQQLRNTKGFRFCTWKMSNNCKIVQKNPSKTIGLTAAKLEKDLVKQNPEKIKHIFQFF